MSASLWVPRMRRRRSATSRMTSARTGSPSSKPFESVETVTGAVGAAGSATACEKTCANKASDTARFGKSAVQLSVDVQRIPGTLFGQPCANTRADMDWR